MSRPQRLSKRMALSRMVDRRGGVGPVDQIAGLEHFFVGYAEDNESPEVRLESLSLSSFIHSFIVVVACFLR
jgi:hypothetical protein